MFFYVLFNVIIAVIGIAAVLYLLFRFFAWRQGDARFVIDARHRKPFEMKEITQNRAVFETEVPITMPAGSWEPSWTFTLGPSFRVNSTIRLRSSPNLPIRQPNAMTTTGNLLFLILAIGV